jgi:hypothetical protein
MPKPYEDITLVEFQEKFRILFNQNSILPNNRSESFSS